MIQIKKLNEMFEAVFTTLGEHQHADEQIDMEFNDNDDDSIDYFYDGDL